ncbi:MAG: hypothetical protein WC868_08950, partial [Bacteroidales bacterium]
DEHPSKYRCMLSFGWDKDIKNNCNFVWILRQYLVRKRLCRRVNIYSVYQYDERRLRHVPKMGRLSLTNN